jgi:DNA-binding beta-propeller fold protein YncE
VTIATCLAGTIAAPAARAAVGDLMQKRAERGCVAAAVVASCARGPGLVGAGPLAISPDGRSVYVGSTSEPMLAVLDRAADGSLRQKRGPQGCFARGADRPCIEARGLDETSEVSVSPDGRSVYVASSLGDAVAMFDRADDGTLSQKPGAAGCLATMGEFGCTPAIGLTGATSATVSPDGRSVYVAGYNNAAVAVLDRARDGALTQRAGPTACVAQSGDPGCVQGRALDRPTSTAMSPDGRSVYVSAADSKAVALFDRGADGALTQKPGPAGCVTEGVTPGCVPGRALEDPGTVTVSPDGRTAYVTSYYGGTVAVLRRAANGKLRQPRGSGGCFSETGAAGMSATGARECAALTSVDRPISMAVSPDGRNAYVVSGSTAAVAVLDRAGDGTLRQRPGAVRCVTVRRSPPCPTATSFQGAGPAVVSPDGRNLYVTAIFGAGAVLAFDRQPIAPPVLRSLSLSPRRFRAAGGRSSVAARAGTAVAYALSERATVTFTIERAVAGRRAAGRCVAARAPIGARRCTRYTPLPGRFVDRGQRGRNRLHFGGSLAGRALRPGMHRLTAVATAPTGGASRPRRIRFRIVR